MYQRDGHDTGQGGWLEPRPPEPSLQRSLRTLRERRWMLGFAVFAAVAVAALYVELATPVYEAEAHLLVSPVSDPSLAGVTLVSGSSDPNRDVQTVALLATTEAVAARAQRRLRSPSDPQDLLARIRAAPVAGSDIVALTARDSAPSAAAATADAFATAVVQDRAARMNAQLEQVIPRLQALVDRQSTSPGGASDALLGRLAALKELQGGKDPSVQFETAAAVPSAPVAPRKALSVAAGAIIGLLLGLAGAFAANVLDPRLRRESQVEEMFDLPILARIPHLRGRRPRKPVLPAPDQRHLLAAYRTLDNALDALDGDAAGRRARSILFTGPARGDGCTSTALHYAWLLGAEGQEVVLVDGDLRHADAAHACDAEPSRHAQDALEGQVPLEDALVRVDATGVKLRIFSLDERFADGFLGERILLVLGNRLIARSHARQERIVIDAPALADGIHALPLARATDRLVVVVRLGATRLAALRELGEVLARHGLRPDGLVIVGAGPGRDYATSAPAQAAGSKELPPEDEARVDVAPPVVGFSPPRSFGVHVSRAGPVLAVAAASTALGLLAGVNPMIGLAAVVAVLFAAVAIVDVRLGLCLFVFLSFLEVLPVPLGPAASFTKLGGLVVAVAWLLAGERRGGRPALPRAGAWLLAAFVAWSAASLAWAPSSAAAASATARYALNVVLFVIVCGVVRTRRDVRWVVTAFVAGAAVAAAYGLLQFPSEAGSDTLERAVGTLGDANEFAAVLVAALPLALALTVDRGGPAAVRWLALGVAGVSVAGIALSLSRGGLLALSVALVAGVVVAGRWRPVALVTAVLIALAASTYFAAVAPVAARERVTSSQGGTGRSDIWRVGWRMVEAHPVLGVGVGNFAETSVQYLLRPGELSRSDLIAGTPKVAHNTYLNVLAELGAIGALAFTAVIGFAMVCGTRAASLFARLDDRTMEILSRAWIVAVCGVLAADFFVSAEFSKQLWLLLALGPCLLAVARSSAARMHA